jgi:hypothetical protein
MVESQVFVVSFDCCSETVRVGGAPSVAADNPVVRTALPLTVSFGEGLGTMVTFIQGFGEEFVHPVTVWTSSATMTRFLETVNLIPGLGLKVMVPSWLQDIFEPSVRKFATADLSRKLVRRRPSSPSP